jgi:hypothetical protein
VPYEKGWSATVNGEPVPVEQVNYWLYGGALPCRASEIRFDYMTYGLPAGALITLISALLLGIYLLLWRAWRRRYPQRPAPAQLSPQAMHADAQRRGSEGARLTDRHLLPATRGGCIRSAGPAGRGGGKADHPAGFACSTCSAQPYGASRCAAEEEEPGPFSDYFRKL